MSKKNSINVALKGHAPEEGAVDIQAFEAKAAKGAVAEEIVEPAIVCSMVDYPITIKYGEDDVRISGRAREKFADASKLPSQLPKGLVSKKL